MDYDLPDVPSGAESDGGESDDEYVGTSDDPFQELAGCYRGRFKSKQLTEAELTAMDAREIAREDKRNRFVHGGEQLRLNAAKRADDAEKYKRHCAALIERNSRTAEAMQRFSQFGINTAKANGCIHRSNIIAVAQAAQVCVNARRGTDFRGRYFTAYLFEDETYKILSDEMLNAIVQLASALAKLGSPDTFNPDLQDIWVDIVWTLANISVKLFGRKNKYTSKSFIWLVDELCKFCAE